MTCSHLPSSALPESEWQIFCSCEYHINIIFSLAKPEVPEPPPTSAPANPDEITVSVDMDSPPAESPAEPGN